eukprot:g167.t1
MGIRVVTMTEGERVLAFVQELQGDVPGLDIIRRQESVKLRAVLCHPLHQISLESVVELHGNDHMNPPRCVASGNLSTETTYALQVQVELLVDQQPDASIFYELEGSSSPVTYTAPFVLTTPGLVTISSWAEKPGFDPSSRTSCSYWIDGAARLTLRATWPEPSPLLGFSSTEGAFLVERDLETLAFLLEVPGVTDTSSLQLQYRLWRGLLGVGSWQAVPSGGAMHLKLSDHLEAANTTTLLQVDWRNPAARVLFSIRSEVGQPEVGDGALLTMSHENFTSLTSAGAMLEHFRSSVPNAGLQPEEMPNACGGTALQLLAVEVPKLCDYLGPFEARRSVSGNVLTITPQLQVLPSVSSFLSFSVGQPDAERQSCVLATPYSYLSTINSSKFIKDCSWLPYNGPRKLYLETLLQEAPAAALTLNVTILTTVRRPGYLWSFPLASTVLWLRERTPLPKVVQILEPGAVMPKAMEGQAAECFFTLHYEPLELSDVPSPFLVEVPAVTASVASIEEAFRPTAYRTALHGPDMLCAWALWQGYLESTPACELMGASGTTAVAEPSFVPSQADLESFQDETVILPEEAGTDVTLRAQLLRPRSTSSGPYRYAVAAMDVKLLMQPGITQNSLTATLQFSAWTDLGLAAPTPLLQLPRRSSSDHVFFVVDVRLLTGVNRWSAETRSAALLLIGTESSPSVVHVGRSLLVDTAAGDPPDVEAPTKDRLGLWVTAGSDGLAAADARLVTVERPCAAPQDVAYARTISCMEGSLIESGTACSTICQEGYSPTVAQLQCSQGQLSPPQFACAEDSCSAPPNATETAAPAPRGLLGPHRPGVNYSASSACLEGNDVAPGGVCTAQCEAGYAPSVQSLGCSRGRLTPSSFSCQEASCQAPEVLHAASPACSGLPQIKSRETCTPLCQDGYVASQTLLHCTRGQLNPETFVCEPGVTVDPSSLALMAAYCFRGPAKIEEKEASDPLKEWWQCVKEVEPGLCVFCGKEPEELETRYEDHGPPTLFRSCSSCAAILGFELEEEEMGKKTSTPEVDEGGSNGQPDEASASAAASAASASGGSEGNMRLSRPPTFTDLRSSKGSISDAVRGLELEKFLTRDEDASQAPSDILPPAPPPDIAMPSRRPDVAASASTTPWPERRRLDSPAEGDRSSERSSFPPSSALHIRTTGGEGGPHEPFRNERSRRERMSLADWQDSPDERPRNRYESLLFYF